jgi:hypothetical protein
MSLTTQFSGTHGALNRMNHLFRLSALCVLGCAGSSASDAPIQFTDGDAATPVTNAAGEIVVTVNTATRFDISRFIYGGSYLHEPANYGGATPLGEMTLSRMGGNRLTAYNWETNHSNAGNDYNFQNDQYLSTSNTPGQAVRDRATPAFAKGQALLLTIPMLGYVAGDACACNVGVTDFDRENRLSTRFRVSRAEKGAPFATTPDKTDDVVSQDEFVNWFERAFPGRSTHPTAPVFFSLDNEPDIWHSTHEEIQSNIGDNKRSPRLQTYAGLTDTSIRYANAIKKVMPRAMVFGPGVATFAGVATAGRYPAPDPLYGTQNFYNVYLDRMRAAEGEYGKRLLDVLDTHWYPAISTRGGEITNDYAPQDSATIWARVQAPRSLWDPTFDEKSWVSGVTGGPIRLIPRLKDMVAANYPGTKLAISEYYYGRGGDISGGIAQADVLGIFGREGVFAAMFWPQAGIWAAPWKGDGTKAYAYVFGAFRMFRNYDGAGGRFGDVGLRTTTSDIASSSAYASLDSAGRTVMVVLNKTNTPKVSRITLVGQNAISSVGAYVMREGASSPARGPDVTAIAGNVVTYSMPAMSVTTLVISP